MTRHAILVALVVIVACCVALMALGGGPGDPGYPPVSHRPSAGASTP